MIRSYQINLLVDDAFATGWTVAGAAVPTVGIILVDGGRVDASSACWQCRPLAYFT